MTSAERHNPDSQLWLPIPEPVEVSGYTFPVEEGPKRPACPLGDEPEDCEAWARRTMNADRRAGWFKRTSGRCYRYEGKELVARVAGYIRSAVSRGAVLEEATLIQRAARRFNGEELTPRTLTNIRAAVRAHAYCDGLIFVKIRQGRSSIMFVRRSTPPIPAPSAAPVSHGKPSILGLSSLREEREIEKRRSAGFWPNGGEQRPETEPPARLVPLAWAVGRELAALHDTHGRRVEAVLPIAKNFALRTLQAGYARADIVEAYGIELRKAHEMASDTGWLIVNSLVVNRAWKRIIADAPSYASRVAAQLGEASSITSEPTSLKWAADTRARYEALATRQRDAWQSRQLPRSPARRPRPQPEAEQRPSREACIARIRANFAITREWTDEEITETRFFHDLMRGKRA